MPTLNDAQSPNALNQCLADINRVDLLIGGNVHSNWSSYDLDSDLMIAADAWHVTLGMSQGQVPPIVKEGAAVEVHVGGETVMTGFIDEISQSISHQQHTLSISGRDQASLLVDCSSPLFTLKQVSLKEITTSIANEFGIKKIYMATDKTDITKKISVNPGDTAWDTLSRAAEANGLWAWFEPDGTLVVGGPDYSNAVSASLVVQRDGKKKDDNNNVISLSMTRSMANRYARITVLGQSPGSSGELGRNSIKGYSDDTAISSESKRKKIVYEPDVKNKAAAEIQARKLIADSRLQGMTLTARVHGHRDSQGKLWQPGQRIHVLSEPHGLDGTYFLMSRKFEGGRGQGTITTLTLKEDCLWLPDAWSSNKNAAASKELKGG